jgi:hypothetical protein
MTHVTEDQLIAAALGERDAAAAESAAETAAETAAVEAHLASCEACRAELAAIRATLDAAASVPVPERGDDYGARVWARLEAHLDEAGAGTAAPRRAGASQVTRWLALAAVLLLAAGAYWLGRQSARPPSVEQARAPEAPLPEARATEAGDIRERVVLSALGEHLDRTERTLVELVNSNGGGAVDISAEQAWARDLLDANRLYRQAAGGAAAPALSQVLEDLEPVLLAIANSPSRLTSDEFRALRDRIESRSLVFKVRVSGADVRARQRALLRQAQDPPVRPEIIRPGESQS